VQDSNYAFIILQAIYYTLETTYTLIPHRVHLVLQLVLSGSNRLETGEAPQS